MLLIDFSIVSYTGFDKVHIEYDMDTKALQFSYSFIDEVLENYTYDYERLRGFLTIENVEQFFKVKTYKYSQSDIDMMPTDTPRSYIQVEYNGRKRTIGDDVYTKKPVILLEKLEEYVDELSKEIWKQILQKRDTRKAKM